MKYCSLVNVSLELVIDNSLSGQLVCIVILGVVLLALPYNVEKHITIYILLYINSSIPFSPVYVN